MYRLKNIIGSCVIGFWQASEASLLLPRAERALLLRACNEHLLYCERSEHIISCEQSEHLSIVSGSEHTIVCRRLSSIVYRCISYMVLFYILVYKFNLICGD